MKIGRVLIHFSSIDSTNDYATDLLAKSEPIEGTVISTDFQSTGRGQGANKWQSQAEKNLLLSVILRPKNLAVKNSFSLNLLGALSVASLIKKKYPDLRPLIKWPNDILVKDRKIAGILIRNQIQSKKIVSSVCGFGINVNQLDFSTIENGRPASSLYLLSGIKNELNDLQSAFFLELSAYYKMLQLNPNMLADLAKSLMLGNNEMIKIQNKKSGETISCMVLRIEITGRIKIRDEDGNIMHIEMTDWKIIS